MSDADENAKLWGSFSQANELSPAQRHRWRLVVRELAGLPDGAVVVDLGCGSGALLERIAQAVPKATLIGIDMEPQALALATRRLPTAQFVRADLDAGLRPAELNGVASAVVCSEVLEHLERPEDALVLANEILRQGGLLIVTVPSGPMNAFDRSIGHRKHYRVPELRSLLEGAGFASVRVRAWGFPFHTLFRLALAVVPAATEEFRDEKLGRMHRLAFKLLDALFYLNVRSRWVGRQLVGTGLRR